MVCDAERNHSSRVCISLLITAVCIPNHLTRVCVGTNEHRRIDAKKSSPDEPQVWLLRPVSSTVSYSGHLLYGHIHQ